METLDQQVQRTVERQRRVSECYRGPYAVLTRDELIAVRRRIAPSSRTEPVLASAARKIDLMLASSDVFGRPMP